MTPRTVRIKKRIYVSADSGFGVFLIQTPDASAPRTIVGSLVDIHEGDTLEIEGEEVEHPRFGRQIRVDRYTLIPPDDTEGIVRFLSSGRIKGIGKKTAQRIAEAFGPATLSVLEHEPERLKGLRGIRASVAVAIQHAFMETRVIRELAVKLSPYGIGMQTVRKIYDEFGEAALAVVTASPYQLIDRVRGISFKTADRIGRAVGVSADDRQRLQAGILFILDQAESQAGDLLLPQPELLSKSALLLGAKSDRLAALVEEMATAGRLAIEPRPPHGVALPRNAWLERESAKRLFALSRQRPERREVVIHFDRIFSRLEIELTAEQKEAVASAVRQPLVVITGGPGTGKTTIIRALIDIFRDNGLEVAIAAPTGRAAKRIEESSYYPASTIHRLLKINPANGRFVHDAHHPLPVDVVVVDEFSMVDAFLLHSLLSAIPDGGQLIIIGDRDQLPSVGAGNVLRDIIASGHFPTIALTHNFRQDQVGLIVENAYRVINGERPRILPYSVDRDFVLVPVSDANHALIKVESILRYYAPEYAFHSQNLQVIVPMYRGDAGIDSINRWVQEKFNANAVVWEKETERFKSGDKIMQVKNNYEKEVFNGDLGVVEGYVASKRTLQVNFDGRRVEYGADEMDELTLAYAVSVHKSQGSEYDVVVLVLLPGHTVMFSRELLYTAITRAKKRLILLSDEETVWRACQNSRPTLRRTTLPLRLNELFLPPSGPVGV